MKWVQGSFSDFQEARAELAGIDDHVHGPRLEFGGKSQRDEASDVLGTLGKERRGSISKYIGKQASALTKGKLEVDQESAV